MIRFLDVLFSSVGLILTSPMLMIIFLLGLIDTGYPLFWQERVGRHKKPFILVKFRTMHKSTESVATHLANQSSVTKFGGFLRKTKLDELPQLWNVLLGDMSLVGPRPCLFNQIDLISERASRGVFDLRPGITGVAQIMGIDMSTPRLLAETDEITIKTMGIKTYFLTIVQTLLGKGSGDRIKQF